MLAHHMLSSRVAAVTLACAPEPRCLSPPACALTPRQPAEGPPDALAACTARAASRSCLLQAMNALQSLLPGRLAQLAAPGNECPSVDSPWPRCSVTRLLQTMNALQSLLPGCAAASHACSSCNSRHSHAACMCSTGCARAVALSTSRGGMRCVQQHPGDGAHRKPTCHQQGGCRRAPLTWCGQIPARELLQCRPDGRLGLVITGA